MDRDVSDYLAVNRANWDERARAHALSPDYAVARFAEDPEFISDVVRFDLPRLGDVAGLDGVHLQCHIGTDTVSLARLGARMTGLDFSSLSLEQARALASSAGIDARFVESDVYDAGDALEGRRFDLVYTGIGALCWLPSITRWAQVVAELLRPGGRLFVRDGHPALATMDERDDGLLVMEFPYFEHRDPVVWDDARTYVETEELIENSAQHVWSHGLGEIVTALLGQGLRLTTLVEHDSAPWDPFPGWCTKDEFGEWRLTERPERLPMTFTLEAVKD
jgi:SAM-dependent methyltransferase